MLNYFEALFWTLTDAGVTVYTVFSMNYSGFMVNQVYFIDSSGTDLIANCAAGASFLIYLNSTVGIKPVDSGEERHPLVAVTIKEVA